MGEAIYPVSFSELPLRKGDAGRWCICVTELDGDDTGFIEVYVTEPLSIDGKQLVDWIVTRIEAVHPPSGGYLAQLEDAQPINLDGSQVQPDD